MTQAPQAPALAPFAVSLLALLGSGVAEAREIHVSPAGSDEGEGSLAEPYATLAQAAAEAQPGDVVTIDEGVYREVLRPAVSGSAEAPIVFQGAPGARVVISAMEPLSGFVVDDGAILRTTVDWDLGQENFVMAGAAAMTLARWPNDSDGDAFTIEARISTGGSSENVVYDAWLDFADGLPDVDWADGGFIHYYGGGGWLAWRAFIKTRNATRVTFDLDKGADWIRTAHAPDTGGEFFLQGVRGALDADGEWFLDAEASTLYLQLPGGGLPADGEVQMRRRTETVDLEGRDYIVLRDLAVFGGTIEIQGTGNRLERVSSFYGNHTTGVVEGATANSQSVNVRGASNVIDSCEIARGTASGVYDRAEGTLITNSYIHDFNSLGNYDAVLNVRGASGGTYEYNVLRRGGRDVIQAFGEGAEYAYNDVSESNLIADDCGLLYSVGGPWNVEIHHNWFHDNASRGDRHKAAGIYLDNDSTAFSVHHNVVWNTEWSSIQLNWSVTDVDIFNNTFVGGSETMAAWHKEGTAFSNVRVWNNLSDGDEWEPQSDKVANLTYVEDPFVDSAQGDFRLEMSSEPVDKGVVISGITKGYVGSAPDIGAYELAADWTAGVEWDLRHGARQTFCYGLPGEDCVEPAAPGSTEGGAVGLGGGSGEGSAPLDGGAGDSRGDISGGAPGGSGADVGCQCTMGRRPPNNIWGLWALFAFAALGGRRAIGRRRRTS